MERRITAAALLLLGALGSLGCELISAVDRDKIPETGSGGAPGTGGTGGMGATGTGGTGGSGTGGTGTGGSGTGGTGTGGSGTGGSGTGGMGTGGTGGMGAVCGDGQIQPGEACDDGNAAAGDGCSSNCQVEDGYTCGGTPSACAPTCGDGMIIGAEACDDGNAAAGDGCSENCQVEGGYTCGGTPSACAPICGDGIIVGAETCDDANKAAGDGCGATCLTEAGYACAGVPSTCATVCGDGIKIGAEACDDGNKIDLDGCSSNCLVDVFTEQEPNDTVAQAGGPFDHDVLVHGAIQPASDVDLFAIQVPATADLRLETFDASGQGSCANIDTAVTFYGTDGTTVLASDDDGGINRCSRLDAAKAAGVRHLPAGTYYVKVEAYNHYKPIPGYSLVIGFDALCGDGIEAGSEACDGTPGCGATCDRIPTCGDGFVDAPETCDDGNTMSGDGCSATCQLEVVAESEANDTAATADGPFHPNALLSGAISPATDVDYFAIQLPATADLRLETFDASGPGSCSGIDTVMTLFGTDGSTVLIARDQGGLNNCSRIDPANAADKAAAHLPAGTYYVKVESHLNGFVIPGYTLLATYAALCGNGVIEGAEKCDGGPGCTATCDRVPVCGDGFVDGPETCDDGNTVSGDGCSSNCSLEIVAETEPNNTFATANGPFGAHALIQASISPTADKDWFAIQVATVSDLEIETFDGSGPGSCAGIDTVATFYGTDGTTILAQQDDGGIGTCSKIDPKVDAGVRHLAPGTYFVRIEDFLNDTTVSSYRLEISFVAVCGDGKVEGAEECDGTPNCDTGCNRIPTCGDGFVDAPETCDDGNTVSGDGCSSNCLLESVAEVEPNGTTAEADAAGVLLTDTATVAGAIGAVGDKDLYKLTLAQPAVVRFETLDGTGADCAIATTLRLLDAGGVELYSDDNSGISSCSALALSLAAGTYYVGVEQQGNTATIAAYVLEVRVVSASVSEVEPNETAAAATPVGAGGDVVVIGGHQSNTDTDFFAVNVPPGRSIRAEIIEGSAAETCESLDIDSALTLYDANGVAVDGDDDGGRGFCSRIDGTGAAPVNAGASKLLGGTYYLAVEAAPFAQAPADTSGQFDYRLVVTIR
ncbi:MAG: DVUA0089 family protein [Minicystis sp.]